MENCPENWISHPFWQPILCKPNNKSYLAFPNPIKKMMAFSKAKKSISASNKCPKEIGLFINDVAFDGFRRLLKSILSVYCIVLCIQCKQATCRAATASKAGKVWSNYLDFGFWYSLIRKNRVYLDLAWLEFAVAALTWGRRVIKTIIFYRLYFRDRLYD